MLPRPPRSPLFPYTTLFRSDLTKMQVTSVTRQLEICEATARNLPGSGDEWRTNPTTADPIGGSIGARSEEHTSELQSSCNLVCRLLLEKKKKKQQQTIYNRT